MKTRPNHVDGFVPAEGRLITPVPRRIYPYSSWQTPDITKLIYERDYEIDPGRYTPRISVRTAGVPDTDPGDSAAYLVAETDPQQSSSYSGRVTRSFAHIPGTHVRYGSKLLTKPVITNESASAYPISGSLVTAVLNRSALWFSDGRVFGPLKNNIGVLVPVVTAGTFTVGFKSSTTGTLNASDSNATIAAAINALAAVVTDGITVSVSNALIGSSTLIITLTAGSTATAFTMTPSFTFSVATSNKAFTQITSATSQAISVARHTTIASHGFTASNALCVMNASSSPNTLYVIPSGQWDIYDADTIRSGLITNVNFHRVGQYLRDYLPGSQNVPTRITERTYLPGVTPGVATYADIPLETPALSDAEIIDAIVSGGGWHVVEFTPPEVWRGPIYKTVTTEVDLDAL